MASQSKHGLARDVECFLAENCFLHVTSRMKTDSMEMIDIEEDVADLVMLYTPNK